MFDYSDDIERVFNLRQSSKDLLDAVKEVNSYVGDYLTNSQSKTEFELRCANIDHILTRTAATELPGLSRAKERLVEALYMHTKLGDLAEGTGLHDTKEEEVSGEGTLLGDESDMGMGDGIHFSEDGIDKAAFTKTAEEVCPSCQGTGTDEQGSPCGMCHGSGYIEDEPTAPTKESSKRTAGSCLKCGGSKSLWWLDYCPECSGGKRMSEKNASNQSGGTIKRAEAVRDRWYCDSCKQSPCMGPECLERDFAHAASTKTADMFPGSGAQVYRNEAGEPTGWSDESGYEAEPYNGYDNSPRSFNREEIEDDLLDGHEAGEHDRSDEFGDIGCPECQRELANGEHPTQQPQSYAGHEPENFGHHASKLAGSAEVANGEFSGDCKHCGFFKGNATTCPNCGKSSKPNSGLRPQSDKPSGWSVNDNGISGKDETGEDDSWHYSSKRVRFAADAEEDTSGSEDDGDDDEDDTGGSVTASINGPNNWEWERQQELARLASENFEGGESLQGGPVESNKYDDSGEGDEGTVSEDFSGPDLKTGSVSEEDLEALYGI